jgi:hypothetical protein
MARSGFFGVLGFDERFQVGQVHFPKSTVLIDPRIDGAERIGIELIDAVTAFAVFSYQVCAAEKTKVFRDGGTGDEESLGDFSGGLAATAQQIEDGATGGIGKGLESGFGGMCNRTVSHNA